MMTVTFLRIRLSKVTTVMYVGGSVLIIYSGVRTLCIWGVVQIAKNNMLMGGVDILGARRDIAVCEKGTGRKEGGDAFIFFSNLNLENLYSWNVGNLKLV